MARTPQQQHDDIRAEYREGHDTHDTWASVMSAFFDIAGALYARDVHLPAEWGYSPGIGEITETEDEGDPLWTVRYSADTLTDFGRVLARYSDMLKSRGDDY